MLEATRLAEELGRPTRLASAERTAAARPTPTIVVGGGCAGLALAVAMIDAGGDLTVAEARRGDADGRAWCSWDVGAALLPEAVSASWTRWEIRTPDGVAVAEDPAHPYRLVRAADYRAAARRRIEASEQVRLREGAPLRGPLPADDPAVRWIDARGPGDLPALRRGRVRLNQRFAGRWIRTSRPVFDPTTVTLMDFTIGDAADGVQFMYVLPVAPDRALVEYTRFTATRTGPLGAAERMSAYLTERWGLAPDEWTTESEEAGSIPMTDQPPDPGGGSSFGLRGGAVRPSTGYAFTRIQLAARRAAPALAAGRPVPPQRDRLRTRVLDAIFLRVLRDRPDLAPSVFLRMFGALPGPLTVRFLTERSSVVDDLRLILALPKRPFLRAAGSTAVERLAGLRR